MKTDTLQVQHDAVKPSCWQQLSGHSPGEHSTAEHSPAGHSPVGHFSEWAPEPDIGVVKSSAQLSHRRSKVVMLADNSSLPPAGPASNWTLSKFNTAQWSRHVGNSYPDTPRTLFKLPGLSLGISSRALP